MPTAKKKPSAPLTFDLPVSQITKLGQIKKTAGLGSASAAIRLALERFDLERYEPRQEPHRQISVRFETKARGELRRLARRKSVSIGELIRAALEAFPASALAKAKRR